MLNRIVACALFAVSLLPAQVVTPSGTNATALQGLAIKPGLSCAANGYVVTWVSASSRFECLVGGGGSTAFSAVTAGTNTAALVVGTGGSLTTSGSGTINASSLGGDVSTLIARLASPTFSGTVTIKTTLLAKQSNIVPILASTPSGGATYQEYWVNATFADGTHTGGSGGVAFTLTGPAVLDATHFNTLTWTAVPGATGYKIYTDERDGTPSTLGLLGTVGSGVLTFRDDGAAGDGVQVFDNTSGSIDTGLLTVRGNIDAGAMDWDGSTLSFNLNTSPSGGTPPNGPISATVVFDPASNGLSATGMYIASYGSSGATHTFGALVGAQIYANNQSGNALTTLDGVQAYSSSNLGSGDILQGDGLYAQYQNRGGTTTTGNAGYFSSENTGAGTTTANNAGYFTTSNLDVGTIAGNSGVYVATPINSGGGAITVNYGVYVKAQGGVTGITNSYDYWVDEQGVYRIRADNTFDSVYQAIPALYNPLFTKYTPGLANYERIVEQWNGNVAEIGTEKGGSGTLRAMRFLGPSVEAVSYKTATNCADSAGAAACGSAAAGAFVVDAAATSVVVSTTAVTANSEIFVFFDAGLGTRLGITCNATVPTVYGVTARTAGTSFTLGATAPAVNPACFSYSIVN